MNNGGIYLVPSSGPLAKVLHLLHHVVAGHVGEDWEPIDIGAGLEVETGENSEAVTPKIFLKILEDLVEEFAFSYSQFQSVYPA